MGTLGYHQIPNGLTLLRVALLPLLTWSFYQQRYSLALICFLIIGFSDFLDGYLARYYGWQSPLGAALDPVADKLVMLISYFMLWHQQMLPLGLWLVVLGRDLLIVIGTLWCRYLIGPYRLQPTRLSKFNTLFELLLVVAVLTVMALPLRAWVGDSLTESLLCGLMLSVCLLSVASGMQYIWIGRQKVLSSHA